MIKLLIIVVKQTLIIIVLNVLIYYLLVFVFSIFNSFIEQLNSTLTTYWSL